MDEGNIPSLQLTSKSIVDTDKPNSSITFFHIKLFLELDGINNESDQINPLSFSNTPNQIKKDIFNKLSDLFNEKKINFENIIIANFIKLKHFLTNNITKLLYSYLPEKLKPNFFDSLIYHPYFSYFLYKYNDNNVNSEFIKFRHKYPDQLFADQKLKITLDNQFVDKIIKISGTTKKSLLEIIKNEQIFKYLIPFKLYLNDIDDDFYELVYNDNMTLNFFDIIQQFYPD